MNLGKIPALILRILKNGKLRFSGTDYSERRRAVLSNFQPFCPPANNRKTLIEKVRHPVLRQLYGQAAYVKTGLSFRGNHLSCGDPSMSYIRIPKCASTAVSKAILERKFPALNSDALSPLQINFLTDANLHHTLTGDDLGRQFFTVVRDPFARIASVYNQFFLTDNKPFIYEDYLFGILRMDLSFADFVKTISVIPDILKDQHFKPQHAFLHYYEKMKVDITILKLEEPDVMRSFFLENGLRMDHLNASWQPYDYRKFYDAQTVQNVYSIYKSDIVRFGYEGAFRDLRTCF